MRATDLARLIRAGQTVEIAGLLHLPSDALLGLLQTEIEPTPEDVQFWQRIGRHARRQQHRQPRQPREPQP